MSAPFQKTFRVLLSKKEIHLLRYILFVEISGLNKSLKNHSMPLHWQHNRKMAFSLLRLYSQPMTKKRQMFPHTIEKLELLLQMLEYHLYSQLTDETSIKLYDRLCSVYKKRKKEQQIINATKQ